MGKVTGSVAAMIEQIHDGATLIAGGFGLCGIPEKLILGLRESRVRDLTVISNNCGIDDWGLGLLLENKQIRKMVASYVGENKRFEQQFLSGELEVELVPQGTLAERLRAGGAGIPAFYTATGVGTEVAKGKEEKVFDGRTYILEKAIKADFGLVKAWRADPDGNLIYRKTAQNFNPLAAKAGKITFAEVEEIVPSGALDPDQIHTPGVYIQSVFAGSDYQKRIERLTVAEN
ncbi:CoA transferase subunit A [Sporolactobacillus vineae]|uniref:CoA transferase subunit A n=1 Tax=Sporolactobacillus vineae TaxID=444463 RepID=UPI0002880566|nr:CoA transferase subunit A [Sporolactobacillus vineae]